MHFNNTEKHKNTYDFQVSSGSYFELAVLSRIGILIFKLQLRQDIKNREMNNIHNFCSLL